MQVGRHSLYARGLAQQIRALNFQPEFVAKLDRIVWTFRIRWEMTFDLEPCACAGFPV